MVVEMKGTNVLLATTNPAKQERLRWLLEGLALVPVTPADLGLADATPQEQGASHEEIARRKAEEWSRLGAARSTGLVLSSDGGLVIPALGTAWQSLLTHRFAGAAADNADRTSRLLELMEPFRGDERRATWVEAVAVARDGRTLGSWQVQGATGRLLEEPGPGPRAPGFWVFPLWYFPAAGKTYLQLDEAELEGLDDHWTQLRAPVQWFFQERGVPGTIEA